MGALDFTCKKRAGGKLDSRWTGPYRIVNSLGRGLYKLESVQNSKNTVTRVNGVHLKRFIMQKEVSLIFDKNTVFMIILTYL